jgi:siroheme synthase (precorrin-2 oxidase/ferrochelatase)
VTLNFTVYFVSNEHVIIYVNTVGRNYICADRFKSEMKFELTQTGSTLENLVVNFEGRCRVTILKPIGPLKSMIMSKMQQRSVESLQGFWTGAQSILTRTFK